MMMSVLLVVNCPKMELCFILSFTDTKKPAGCGLNGSNMRHDVTGA